MLIEKSAGAVVFFKGKQKIKYLLLRYSSSLNKDNLPKEYWGFPKGHIEDDEKEIEAAKREIKEETALEDLKFINGFREKIKYFFKVKNKNVLKFVTFYLAQAKSKEVKISFEHTDYKWFSFEEALGKIKFNNYKKILEKADNFLRKYAC